MKCFLKSLFRRLRPREDETTRKALRDLQAEMQRHTDSIKVNVEKRDQSDVCCCLGVCAYFAVRP
jgi:glucose-6-phosphate-specific signal transduction histidine kinase